MIEELNPQLIYHELKQIRKTIEEHTVADSTNFAELRRLLEGDESVPGMRIRLDRIEQKEQARQYHRGYIWSAIGALATGLGVNFWTR